MSAGKPGIRQIRIRGGYLNRWRLIGSLDRRRSGAVRPSQALTGYSPPIVEYLMDDDPAGRSREVAVRDVDLPILAAPDAAVASRHLALILEARAGDRDARKALHRATEKLLEEMSDGFREPYLHESRFVICSTSRESHPLSLVSDKGSTLLRLCRLGYPVPDFVILSADAYLEWEAHSERFLSQALENLQHLTGRTLNSAREPLIFAIRVAMPHYSPGFMPTYLNVGATEEALPGLCATYGKEVANKILLNNLRNLLKFIDRQDFDGTFGALKSRLSAEEVERLIDRISATVRRKDARLLANPIHQAAFFVEQAHHHYEANADVLLTLSRGKRYYPSVILQQMVCSMRDNESYAGVLYSRHSWTGEGRQLHIGHNIFGEDIMTGTIEPEETSFQDRSEIKDKFPAVHHFVPQLRELEREFESPVTIEFASENTKGHQFFALLQTNQMEMSGRAAFISVVDLHKEGTISRKRVTELICPYHVKHIEADAVDVDSLKTLDLFSRGVSILPRGEVICRIYFSAEAALNAKKRGESVCFCKRTFEPSDTVVMREMDAIISLTSAAIHVVTICQSFGAAALLSLEKFGVSLTADGCLVNHAGSVLREGDWITMSSYLQTLYKGKAKYRPARLVGYLRGIPVDLAEDEKQAFADMAYAYRYYQQLVKGLKLDQISKLNELIRLVNLELRGEVEEARSLVRGWFDSHKSAYVDGVLRSDMGDHLNQHTVFDMLTLDRKTDFFKTALERCMREKLSGYTAGAFMLGRFVLLPQPVAFWRSFEPAEIALLVNEWVLFEKYIQVLHQVGERKIVRAKRRILEDGLDDLPLGPHSVKYLISLKLSGIPIGTVISAVPSFCDRQTVEVLEILQKPYSEFFDFDAPWSVQELVKLCEEENIPVPGPDDA